MLSTLNPKHTDLRDGTEPREDEVRLVARVEEELSKLAHEAGGHAVPAPSNPPPRVETPAPSERPAPMIDVTPRLAGDTAELKDPKPADPRNDPHDFVPISPAFDEPRPAQQDAAPSLNPPPRVAPVFSPTRPARPVPPIEATFRPAARADNPVDGPADDHLAFDHRLAGVSSSRSPGPRTGEIPSEIGGLRRDAQPPRRSWLRRAVTSFLLALVGVGATYAWQHHGDEAEALTAQALAKWAPQVPLPSWLKRPGQNPDQDPAVAAQANQPPPQAAESSVQESSVQPVQAAAPSTATAEVAPPAAQPAAVPAPPPPQPALAAAAAAASPEQAQLLQTMARDLAALQQTIDQLKAGQEQLTREIAKLSEQDARRRVATPQPAPPPRPAPSATRSRPVAAMPAPPPISTRRSYPAQPPSVTQQSAAPQAISPQSLSPQVASPRVMPPPLRPDDPDNAATAPRPPRSLQPQNSDD